jgi:hypothetical protein
LIVLKFVYYFLSKKTKKKEYNLKVAQDKTRTDSGVLNISRKMLTYHTAFESTDIIMEALHTVRKD